MGDSTYRKKVEQFFTDYSFNWEEDSSSPGCRCNASVKGPFSPCVCVSGFPSGPWAPPGQGSVLVLLFICGLRVLGMNLGLASKGPTAQRMERNQWCKDCQDLYRILTIGIGPITYTFLQHSQCLHCAKYHIRPENAVRNEPHPCSQTAHGWAQWLPDWPTGCQQFHIPSLHAFLPRPLYTHLHLLFQKAGSCVHRNSNMTMVRANLWLTESGVFLLQCHFQQSTTFLHVHKKVELDQGKSEASSSFKILCRSPHWMPCRGHLINSNLEKKPS